MDTTSTAPATKAARHALIAQVVATEQIRSQAQLREALAERGVSATQATLSRDLVELRATKVRGPGGIQVYALPTAGAPGQVAAAGAANAAGVSADLRQHATARLARWSADLLVTAEWAGQQLVVRTPAGAAQLLATAIDDAMLPGVLGCIAGDDTILVMCRTSEAAEEIGGFLLGLAEASPGGPA